MPQNLQGIKLLGSGVSEDIEMWLGPWGFLNQPILRRLESVRRLAAQLKELAGLTLDIPSKQPVWLLLTRIVAHTRLRRPRLSPLSA